MTANTNPSPNPPEQRHVGEHLRQLRIEQGLALEEVAEATRISLSNLRALESREYEKLPADTFVKGLIGLYCTYLGIDGQKVAEQYFLERYNGKKMRRTAQHHINDYSLTPKTLAEPSHISSATVAIILFLLIILSFTGFCLYTSWNPFSFLTGTTDKLSSQVLASFHPADPATSTGADKKALNLEVLFLKDSQVQITLDDSQPRQQSFAREASLRLEADRQIRLQFMQPDSATLQLNGSPLPFPQNADGRFVLQIPTPPAAQ